MFIKPVHSPLDVRVRVPGSKSQTNRALLLAVLADGTTRLTNALFSDDSSYFIQALKVLGFNIEVDREKSEISVHGLRGKIPSKKAELYIGNAGTAARFLTAFLALGSGEYCLDGDARMRERPIGDLVEALQQLGVAVSSNNGCPPVEIHAAGLRGGKARITGDISSQFVSALLMVMPYACGPSEIELTTELRSRPYVDMTLAVMEEFGVAIDCSTDGSFRTKPACYKARASYRIESDASAASYFFAAAAVTGGTIMVADISRKSLQGDVRFLDILEHMGCLVLESEDGIAVTGPEKLSGIEADMGDIPDTAQTLAAIAPFAQTPTLIRNIASARLKETDRIHATCTELARLGVQVEEFNDGLAIHPCKEILPGTVQTYNDHRMAMAFSLVGLKAGGIKIENPSSVSKTFPDFYKVLRSLQ